MFCFPTFDRDKDTYTRICLRYNQIMVQTRIKNGNYHVPLLVLREEYWRKRDMLERTCFLMGMARPWAQLLVLYGASVARCSDVYVTCPNFETSVQNILKDSVATLLCWKCQAFRCTWWGPFTGFRQYASLSCKVNSVSITA